MPISKAHCEETLVGTDPAGDLVILFLFHVTCVDSVYLAHRSRQAQ